MAAATDKLMEVGIATATTLDANYTINDTSITVASTSGWPTATGVAFAIDVVDSNGVQVPGTYNEYVGVVSSATSITSVDHMNGTDRNYSAGATTRVYLPVSAERENRIVEWGLVEHDQDGTHSDITATSITATTGTFTNLTIAGTASAEGWSPLGATPNTVTSNGNRSYDLVFNGTDLTDTISEGMRIRTARTVAAPTNAFSLDGTNDYYNDTTVNGMSFTDDFVAGAWVYLTAYGGATGQPILSRQNGTSGFELRIGALGNGDGRVQLTGYNGGSGNFSTVVSYQSIPLNKWVHISAQLDMSAFTATSTTSYVMINGVDIPSFVQRGGTNPTALIQAGNLEVGGSNATSFFTGYIDQAFVSSAKITQANIRTIMNQAWTSALVTTHSIVSAYSGGSTTDINTTNANNLTAQNGATTVAKSPFATNGFGTSTGTTDYGIVQKAVFSTNTTLTVQVPEGCTIPTSGGVSGMFYSINDVPYGFPRDKGRWYIVCLNKTFNQQASPVADTWYHTGALILHLPAGNWSTSYTAQVYVDRAVAGFMAISATLSTSASAETNSRFTVINQSAGTALGTSKYVQGEITSTTLTGYYLLIRTTTASMTNIYTLGERGVLQIVAEPSLL